MPINIQKLHSKALRLADRQIAGGIRKTVSYRDPDGNSHTLSKLVLVGPEKTREVDSGGALVKVVERDFKVSLADFATGFAATGEIDYEGSTYMIEEEERSRVTSKAKAVRV